MPPENSSPVSQEPTPVARGGMGVGSQFMLAGLVIAIVAGVGYYVAYYVVGIYGFGTAATKGVGGAVPMELVLSKRAGDYDKALEEYKGVVADPTKGANEKALAVFNAGKLRFKLSGDINELLVDIQNLKKIILNENLDQRIQIRALNTLASSYCSSGRDPLAFEEIYKDAPFNQYLAAGDPDRSALNLAKWSYETRPTAFAAVRIARWYGDQLVNDENLTTQEEEQYATIVREYVQNGESLVKQELIDNPDYKNSAEYAGYLFWRARAYGRLAIYGDEWYKERYQQTFKDVIEYVEQQGNVESLDDLYFAHQYLAQFSMKVEKDQETAKTSLDALSARLDSLKNPVVVTFVRFIRNEYKNRPDGGSWQGILKMTKVSPAYKASVERVLALSPSVLRPEGLDTVGGANSQTN